MSRYQVDHNQQQHHNQQQQQGDEEHHPPTHLPAPARGNTHQVEESLGRIDGMRWAHDVIRYLHRGNTLRTAAQLARRRLDDVEWWLANCEEFRTAAEHAQATAVDDVVGGILAAAGEGEWRAGIEWLKRRHRADWGDVTQVQVLTTLTQRLQSMTDEEFAALAAQVATRALPAESTTDDTAIDVETLETL